MVFEVYTGARPGRPRLLVLIGAALLAGTLGMAWLQVCANQALAPERHIEGTPLWVQLPRGWHPDPKDGRRFLLPAKDRRRRGVFEFERRIVFDYSRRPAFEPVDRLIQDPQVVGPWPIVQSLSARIGKYDAIEIHQAIPLRIGRTRFHRRTITRLTCLPRGQVLKVVYEPLIDLRPADLEILEQVCQTLRVDDPTLNGNARDYLERAGLVLPLEDGWQVVGADFPEVPGVYIGGLLRETPAWSIAILRTWLATGRTPRDLLTDLAADKWLVWDLEELSGEAERSDGTSVVTAHHPEFGRSDIPTPAAWVVQQSPTQAVVMLVQAGAREAPLADEAARRIATTIEISPLDYMPDIQPAEAAGAALVEALRTRGPASHWGFEDRQMVFREVGHDVAISVRREALGPRAARGYRGKIVYRAGRREDQVAWRLAADAGEFEWEWDFYHGRSPMRITEQRQRTGGEIVRGIYQDQRRQHRWRFTPGDGFVPPPAESIVTSWAAREADEPALVELSTHAGPGAHTALMRRLPPDGDRLRVLVQRDYSPAGWIEVFDSDRGELLEEIHPEATYRRVR